MYLKIRCIPKIRICCVEYPFQMFQTERHPPPSCDRRPESIKASIMPSDKLNFKWVPFFFPLLKGKKKKEHITTQIKWILYIILYINSYIPSYFTQKPIKIDARTTQNETREKTTSHRTCNGRPPWPTYTIITSIHDYLSMRGFAPEQR